VRRADSVVVAGEHQAKARLQAASAAWELRQDEHAQRREQQK